MPPAFGSSTPAWIVVLAYGAELLLRRSSAPVCCTQPSAPVRFYPPPAPQPADICPLGDERAIARVFEQELDRLHSELGAAKGWRDFWCGLVVCFLNGLVVCAGFLWHSRRVRVQAPETPARVTGLTPLVFTEKPGTPSTPSSRSAASGATTATRTGPTRPSDLRLRST